MGWLFNKMNIFNFLRGFAAISIVLYHVFYVSYKTLPNYSPYTILNLPGWTCVWIFFIISGYLIGKGFINDRYKTDSWRDFFTFYIQRIIRILPIYFFVIIIDMFFINTGTYLDFSNQYLKRALTLTLRYDYLTAMNGNLWFICTLLQLYLLAPLVYKFIIKPIKNCIPKNIGIISLICLVILSGLPYGRIYENVLYQLDLFFTAFLFNYFICFQNDTRFKQILRPISLLLFFIFFIFNSYLIQETWNLGAKAIKLYFPSLTIFVILNLFYAFDVKHEKLKSSFIEILKNPIKWIEACGPISMGIFLCHSQTICKLVNIVHFDSPTVLYINPLNILDENIKISFSAQAKSSYLVALLAVLSAIIWGVIIHFMLEKPLNKYRQELKLQNNQEKKSQHRFC